MARLHTSDPRKKVPIASGGRRRVQRSLFQNRRVTSTNSKTVKNRYLNWKLYNFTLFKYPFHIYS